MAWTETAKTSSMLSFSKMLLIQSSKRIVNISVNINTEVETEQTITMFSLSISLLKSRLDVCAANEQNGVDFQPSKCCQNIYC